MQEYANGIAASYGQGAFNSGITYSGNVGAIGSNGIAQVTIVENGDYGSSALQTSYVNAATGEVVSTSYGSSMTDIMNSGPALSQGGGPDAVDALNGEFDSMWEQNAQEAFSRDRLIKLSRRLRNVIRADILRFSRLVLV